MPKHRTKKINIKYVVYYKVSISLVSARFMAVFVFL